SSSGSRRNPIVSAPRRAPRIRSRTRLSRPEPLIAQPSTHRAPAAVIGRASRLPMDQPSMDFSGGYESVAQEFMLRRDPVIGVATVREWARKLPSGSTILDLGCGHG